MSKNPQTQVTQILTQAVQTVQAGINFTAVVLKKGVKVPELLIYEEPNEKPKVYPLLGPRYVIGRSSKSCDIVVRSPIVSQIHLSLHRDPKNSRSFMIKDEKSTNGIFRNKTRLKYFYISDGDKFTIGPPELANSVLVKLRYPRPLWMNVVRYFLYGLSALIALIIIGLGIGWSKVSVYPLPTEASGPIIVYARDEQVPLTPARIETHRELSRLANFSPYLPKAVIASEDSRYYWHLGVDPLGILRALVINAKKQEIRQGASTLTQQLARSLFPQVGRENTTGRKLREMVVALKLEAVYSKDELLKTYLNRVFLGFNNFGFEDAAQFYFDKSAADLTLSEAATLVATLPAPNSYNPIQDLDTAVALRNRVIDRMEKLQMVTTEEANRARRSRIIDSLSPTARDALSNIIAPYFYSYVLEEVNRLLGAEVAQEGNFIVETGLDTQLQKQAEQAFSKTLQDSTSRFGFAEGALVTLNSNTGEILAFIGGKDYSESQFNRVTQAQRQPGSTFKLFTYAGAIEQGISPSKTYSCNSLVWEGRRYKPCERSEGDINMYTGFAQSENVVALRIAQEVGLDKVVEMSQRLGIKSPLNPVPGLVLGQSEVNLLEITGAYAAVANKGVWHQPHAIQRILDGNDCEDPQAHQTCQEKYNFAQQPDISANVLDSSTVQIMTDLMEEVVETGTGRAASLDIGGMREGGKTGTTDNNVDLWFIGYLPEYNLVTGIWLGNDDNTPTWGSSSQAAAIWGNYMNQVVDSKLTNG